MRVKWLRKALANFEAETEYVAEDNPQAAAEIAYAITRATARLQSYPASGRPGRVTGTRELVVPGTPYILPYRVRGDEVQILRVFHGARKWPTHF